MPDFILKRSGVAIGTQACYISTVTKIVQKTFVDEERKMNLATPAIFIVAAKASFQRNQSNLSRGSVATIDFQPFLSAEPDFRAHTEQPLTQSRSANKKDAAWLDFSDYVAPDADMAQRAARLSASVHRYIEFLDHAERSNIILSDSARQKLESAISEFE